MKTSAVFFFKGFLMGSADVVPGISGGTLALVTGIYPRLIAAILSFNTRLLGLFVRFRLKEALASLDLAFLIPLALGIGTALLSMSRLLHYLLIAYPVYTWGVFFGFVLSSALTLFFTIPAKTPLVWVSGLLGVLLGYAVLTFSPASVEIGLPYLFLCGALAICAMILPGISGSYILVLMGAYHYFLGFLKNPFVAESLLGILVFALGAILGLLGFSRILGWLLKRYYSALLACMTGIMLGSLGKIWPWKTSPEGVKSLKESLAAAQNTLPSLEETTTWVSLPLIAGALLLGYLMAKKGVEHSTEND